MDSSTNVDSSNKGFDDWRIRDEAARILDQRQSFLPAADKVKSLTGKGPGRGKRQSVLDTLPLATADAFKVEASLKFLKSKKSNIVHAAFSAAATSVLRSLLRKAQGENDEEKSTDDEDDDGSINNLPSCLTDRNRISELRQSSFVRSLENKEWAKKRSVASDPSITAPSASGPKRGRKRKAESNPPDAPDPKQPVSETGKGDAAKKQAAEQAMAEKVSSTIVAPKKFTRNTPASSAAALDHRFTNSRAILCAAGNLVMAKLTPDLPGHELEPNDVPQKKKHTVNLGAVLVDANVYSQRAIAIALNAAQRAKLRYKYRKENARYKDENSVFPNEDPARHYMQIPNLFGWRENGGKASPWTDFAFKEDDCIPYRPNKVALTDAWSGFCKDRLQAIVENGGNALYHDMQWSSRHARLANFLNTLKEPGLSDEKTKKESSFGPHLIVTMQPDTVKFAQEFYDMRSSVRLVLDRYDEEDNKLRCLLYQGQKEERRKLRKHFSSAAGLATAPFHVIVVSYTDFLQDYLHFCQVPFEVVILDDGASWMAASHGDPNSTLATVEKGIWSGHQHVGLAGTFGGGDGAPSIKWDFDSEEITESALKDACLGLTCRNRVMTASQLVSEHRMSVELLPISGVVSFLVPFFSSVVQEEWDRSNIAKDAESMQHFRRLVARSMVVHHEDSPVRDMHELAISALEGQMGFTERFGDPITPGFISDEDFVSAEKVTFSRRACLSWLGSKSVDWLRYELGKADFGHILDAMKTSTRHGHFCEEITTASSTTSSGVTGQVSGTMAYRLAVCCVRHFGSQQGLAQHISAQHAPPGTWLCRTCGSDCITSQARTHHERTCGQPTNGSSGEPGGSVGANPTVGQGPKSSAKKKSQRTVTSTQQGGVSAEEKDPDGSLRVPGYRGVWVNKQGKHFIKVDGTRYAGNGGDVLLFDSNDGAARKYDAILSERASETQTLELNFKTDGKRNIYEDATSSTASGLGGSAANVVPLLSVINIKDLPPDVKPLLRDPRQTSRTGGNSKRHVYAYRGVCRQARKGHDRWQSQISFMGVNHYLGTFDSEWDAAAIYAWAHLILYGDEATKQAQKEGEEAAAAYEQEKKDIAAGKIPEPPPKPEKKKKQAQRKKPEPTKSPKKTKPTKVENAATATIEPKVEVVKKRKTKSKDPPVAAKNPKTDTKTAKEEKEAMNATLSLGAVKTPVLGKRGAFSGLSIGELESMVSLRIQAARGVSYCVGDLKAAASAAIEAARPSLPIRDSRGKSPLGAAMLAGLPHSLGWSLEDFVETNVEDEALAMTAVQVLAAEYDDGGVNEKFRSLMQGTICVLGRATERMARQFRELAGTSIVLGCGIGELDCHVGGIPGTCSSEAACIRYTGGEYHLCCLSDQDVVTLNGQRISTGMEWVALGHNDVCSIGPRVFVFLLPK
mmetsp:Transcript_7518/g.15687  ORF Transcript_7518/g.15687 Transcript_7518/m.15687 type:complete len:1420 (-) Transcript_7518:2102-6361(-)